MFCKRLSRSVIGFGLGLTSQLSAAGGQSCAWEHARTVTSDRPDPIQGTAHITTADVNGDGLPDVIQVFNERPNFDSPFSSFVRVWSNQGALGFTEPEDTLIEDDYRAYRVVARDFNGDGHIDLLVSTFQGSSNRLLINNGAGRFSTRREANFSYPYLTEEGDVNGDGLPDFVTAAGQGPRTEFRAQINDGTGAFSPGSMQRLYQAAHAMRLADIDADGDLDLLLALRQGQDWGVIGDSRQDARIEIRAYTYEDGFSRDRSQQLYVTGENSPSLCYAGPPTGSHPESGRPYTNFGFRFVVEDFDQDGFPDLAIVRGVCDPQMPIYLDFAFNDGAGGFPYQSTYEVPTEQIAADVFYFFSAELSAADLDQDGDQDLIVVPQTSTTDRPTEFPWFTFFNNGGDFSEVQTYSYSTDAGYADASLQIADMDGDGAPEVLLERGRSLHIVPNRFVRPARDCNANGRADVCDLADGESDDCDGDGTPDECQPDADGDGVIDACEADSDGDGVIDDRDLCPGGDDLLDADGDGSPDCLDPPPSADQGNDGVLEEDLVELEPNRPVEGPVANDANGIDIDDEPNLAPRETGGGSVSAADGDPNLMETAATIPLMPACGPFGFGMIGLLMAAMTGARCGLRRRVSNRRF